MMCFGLMMMFYQISFSYNASACFSDLSLKATAFFPSFTCFIDLLTTVVLFLAF